MMMTANKPLALLLLTALLIAPGCTLAIDEAPPDATDDAVAGAKEPELPPDRQKATFGGGCFWCVEAVFQRLDGVEKVVSGYSGGQVDNPTYEQICTKTTGHAEVCQITYDQNRVSYPDLLEVFFATHDPTTLDRQGNDVGPQYRSVIFHHDDEQKLAAEAYLEQLTADGAYDDPLVTEVTVLTKFWPADGYHQNYFNRNPAQAYCVAVVAPKVKKFKKRFEARLKKKKAAAAQTSE